MRYTCILEIREMTLFIEQNLHLDKKLNEVCECGGNVEQEGAHP